MTTKAWVLFICICMLVLSGCGSPVFTVEVFETPTAYEVANPTPTQYVPAEDFIIPTDQPITEPPGLPTFPVTLVMPPGLPSDFSPVLYGKKYDANTFFLVLGGVQGQTWYTPEEAATRFSGELNYDVYTFTNNHFQVLGHAPQFSPVSGGYYSMGTDIQVDEFGMVGVVQGWPIRQASIQELDPQNETYQKVVLDWLKAQGLSAPELGVMHIYRVDLEGDNTDEIFISATHLDESQHTTRNGDYSIVLMRKLVGTEVMTIPLAADVYHSQQLEITYPSTYLLGNFIDLNRDGILEVVIDFERWEGFGAIVYQVQGKTATEVLR